MGIIAAQTYLQTSLTGNNNNNKKQNKAKNQRHDSLFHYAFLIQHAMNLLVFKMGG